MSISYKISGRGEKGGPVKKMLIFTANLFVDGKAPEATKEDLQVYIESPGDPVKTNIMGGSKGLYHIGFTPNTEGQHWVDFVFKGTWADEPYLLPIDDGKPGKNVPAFPYAGKIRNELSGAAKKAEEERLRKEEEERKHKEEEERLRKEEEERKRKEEEERKRKEEEERKRKEEEERKRKEEEERKRKEEEEKKRKELEEKKRKEEEERKRKEEEEKKKELEDKKKQELDKKKKEEEDKKRKEEEDKKRKEEEDKKRKEEENKKNEENKKESAKASAPAPAEKKTQPLIPAENPVGAYAGHIDSMMVMFRALNKHGQPRKTGGKLEQFTVYTNGEKVENVEDVGEGLYCFDYQSIHGNNEIDVQYNGKSIKGFPIVFTRKTEEEIIEEALLIQEEEDRIQKEEEERKRKEEEEERKKQEEMLAKANKATNADDKAKKLEELEERKRQVEEKKKQIAEAKAKAAAPKPENAPKRTDPPSHRALMWEQRLAKGEEKKTGTKKVELPEGAGASKLASLWQQKLQGKDPEKEKEEEKKATTPGPSKGTFTQKWIQNAIETPDKSVKKTTVDLPQGAGASKLATVWQKKLEGKDQGEEEVKKTTVELPDGTGASKLASKWESKLKGEDDEESKEVKRTVDINAEQFGAGASKFASQWENKLKGEDDTPTKNVDKPIPKADPSKLAAKWESQVSQNSASNESNTKKDIEELKQLMAKEREQLLSSDVQEAIFSGDPEELEILVRFLNTSLTLVEDKLPHPLPLPSDNSLFQVLSDGVIMCHFFAQTIPDALDEGAIKADAQSDEDKVDNWNLCIQAAQSSGCKLNDVQAENLVMGDEDAIQRVIWQIVKLGLETDVKLQTEYIEKVFPGESPEEVEEWPIDKLLTNWVNEIMKKRGESRVAESISNDFKDSYFYIILLDEVVEAGTTMLEDDDVEMKAMEAQDQSTKLSRTPCVTATGIVEGVYWQNFIFLASLFLEAAEK